MLFTELITSLSILKCKQRLSMCKKRIDANCVCYVMENNGKHMINLKNMKKIFDFFVGTFPLCCASYGELLKKIQNTYLKGGIK